MKGGIYLKEKTRIMASSAKQPRLHTSIYGRFSKEPEVIKEFKTSFDLLFHSPAAALESLTIAKCNADFGGGKYGQPLSKAYVEVEDNYDDSIFLFGSIFLPAYKLLESYLQDPMSAPSERQNDFVLSKLLEFLLDKDNETFLRSVQENIKEECDLAVRLAEHLLAKLSVSSSYTIDKDYPGGIHVSTCRCGCGVDVYDHYGDTSIGSTKVWHGSLDLILNSMSVAVVDRNPDSPGRKSRTEVKDKPDLEHPQVTSQLVSQTIVFSFAQKKRHPEYRKYLIPIIGVNRTKVTFYFYDSEHDILLKSRVFRIFERNKLNYDAILAVWLVVNYKYLCSGCTKEITNEAKKANFFEHVGSQLSVYQNELSVGGVGLRYVDVFPYIPGNIKEQKIKNIEEILAEESEEGYSPMGLP